MSRQLYLQIARYGSQFHIKTAPVTKRPNIAPLYLAQKSVARHFIWRDNANMPKQIKTEELSGILEEIKKHPAGIGIDALHEIMQQYARRTLQRRLALLVEKGLLLATGSGRSLKYKIAPIQITADVTLPPLMAEAEAETYISISPEAQEIKDHVRQTIQQRPPTGYNPSFLESYTPNETSFLSEETRQQLHLIGRTTQNDQPAGTFARDILGRLLIDLSWASSQLEGNTYSLLDTQKLIEYGEAAEGKDALETQMILNHKAAIEMLIDQVDEIGFNRYTLLNLHAILSDGLLPDPRDCGRLREKAVGIGGSTYLPLALPQKIDEQFNLFLEKAQAISDPFEQAIFSMVFIPYLQPFSDVNKRVSRLVANVPLILNNLCPLSFIDVPEHAYVDATLGVYELNRPELLRDVFIWAYERSCQQYLAIQQSLIPPDSFRLRYRTVLYETIRELVSGNRKINPENVLSIANKSVDESDMNSFVELVQNEAELLHEGNIARFGLRPSEFRRWKDNR